MEFLRLPDYRTVPFGGEEKFGGQLHIHGTEHLAAFQLDAGLPVWRYEVEGFELEKRIYFRLPTQHGFHSLPANEGE